MYFILLRLVYCAFQYHEQLSKFGFLKSLSHAFWGKNARAALAFIIFLVRETLTSSFLLSPSDSCVEWALFLMLNLN